MGIGIRIDNLRKVYDTPPPSAARGGGFSFTGQRAAGSKEKKKKFEVVAIDGISLTMGAGEVFGLLGPNGAGKSTTIGVLTTRTRPTSGRAFIGDYDVWQEQVKAKRLIGVVPQRPNLDFALTAREVLLFHGAYFGQSARERERRSGELLEKFHSRSRRRPVVRGRRYSVHPNQGQENHLCVCVEMARRETAPPFGPAGRRVGHRDAGNGCGTEMESDRRRPRSADPARTPG